MDRTEEIVILKRKIGPLMDGKENLASNRMDSSVTTTGASINGTMIV